MKSYGIEGMEAKLKRGEGNKIGTRPKKKKPDWDEWPKRLGLVRVTPHAEVDVIGAQWF